MSVHVSAEVWASDVDEGRLTLLALADIANDAGICWPGTALLCGNTQKSRATVFRDLAKLEAAGLIERHERKRKNGSLTSNIYVINRKLLRDRKRPTAADERREMDEMIASLTAQAAADE